MMEQLSRTVHKHFQLRKGWLTIALILIPVKYTYAETRPQGGNVFTTPSSKNKPQASSQHASDQTTLGLPAEREKTIQVLTPVTQSVIQNTTGFTSPPLPDNLTSLPPLRPPSPPLPPSYVNETANLQPPPPPPPVYQTTTPSQWTTTFPAPPRPPFSVNGSADPPQPPPPPSPPAEETMTPVSQPFQWTTPFHLPPPSPLSVSQTTTLPPPPLPFPSEQDMWTSSLPPPYVPFPVYRPDDSVPYVSPFNLTTGEESEFWQQVADEYFRYCGLSCKTGNTQADIHVLRECDSCFCDEACFDYGDCCPDRYAEAGHGPVQSERRNNLRCEKTAYGPNQPRYYSMVTACPDDAKNTEIGQLCEKDDNFHWNFTQPVSDSSTFLTFKNKYCARCHGVTDTIPWDVAIIIHDKSTLAGLTTSEQVFHTAINDDVNEVVYNCSESLRPHCRECVPSITRCNLTGLWIDYDPLVDRACTEFYAPAVSYPTFWETVKYLNPFCYLCNTYKSWDKLTNAVEMPGISGSPDVPPLLMLLDLSDGSSQEAETPAQKENKCPEGQFFDQYTEECREIACARGKTYVSSGNGTCESPFEDNLFGYMFCLQSMTMNITPVEDYLDVNHFTDFYREYYNILDDIDLMLWDIEVHRFRKNKEEREMGKYLVLSSFFVQTPFDRDQMDADILQRLPNISYTFESILQIPGLRLSPTCSPTVFKNLYKNTASSDSSTISFIWFTTGRYTSELARLAGSVTYLPVTNHLLCPSVILDTCDVKFYPETGDVPLRLSHEQARLFVRQAKRNVSSEYFHINEELKALVCLDQYQDTPEVGTTDHTVDQGEREKQGSLEGAILDIVDKVCVSVSLFFLLVSFLLYCLLPELRSIAGVNNLLLIVALFWAQVCLQVSGYVRHVGWLCEAVGCASHWFWLNVVLAQNACTFHLFYTLSFPLRSHAVNTNVRRMATRYIAYVLTTASLLVAVVVVWQVLADGHSGYGGDENCFIRNLTPRIVTFFLPLGLTVVANVAMFIFTVVRLRSLPSLSSTHSNKISLLLYTKLSVFTGLTWLFGFLATGLQSMALAYTFVIMQDLQGLFVFLAFLANKRVLNMVRVRLGKEVKGGTSQSSHVHTKTSALKTEDRAPSSKEFNPRQLPTMDSIEQVKL